MTESSSRPLKVFLCHSSGDKAVVRELYRQLSAEDWIAPWLDEVNLLPGQEWDLEIEKAVEEADIVMVCLSTRSVDKEGYIQKELRFVLNIAEEKPEGSLFIIPLRLDDCIVPRRLKHWQWVDYFPESQKSFAYNRLLESFKLRAKRLGISYDKPKEIFAEEKKASILKRQNPLKSKHFLEETTFSSDVNSMGVSVRKKIRVLVVDDVTEIRENIRKLLQFESDIEVVGLARDGKEAIQLSQKLNPDVVLMDTHMPNLDGIAATDAICSRQQSVEVIILSISSDSDIMRRALLAGARDFLVKPLIADELISSIRRVAQKK